MEEPGNLLSSNPARIGDVLVASGKMTPAQAEAAAALGAQRNLLFGQAAVLLGFVSRDDVQVALDQHRAELSEAESIGISADIVTLHEPLSPMAGDIRRLAQTLAIKWFRGDAGKPALSVISAQRHDGRSSIAANLACVFARAGVRTLLIDADLHNPNLHLTFGLRSAPNIGSQFFVPAVSNLAILPAASLFNVNFEKFMQTTFAAMIEARSAEFDVIFVDTPAAELSDDYLLAGLATRGAMVVTRDGKTGAKATARMLNSCEDAGIPIVGGIMLK